MFGRNLSSKRFQRFRYRSLQSSIATVYVNKVRKLYHARYKCNNKRDSKIINLNKMAIPKKAYLSCFAPRKQIRGDLKAHLAIEMSLNNT